MNDYFYSLEMAARAWLECKMDFYQGRYPDWHVARPLAALADEENQ